MKKIIFTFLICSISLALSSQSEAWTKADRTNLYDDCMSSITKYKSTTNEQRESISLCYIGEITKKYTKADFQAMIDIEIKRIKEAVVNQCAKNLGIDLNAEAKKEEVVVEKKEVVPVKTGPNKEGLLGKWKSDSKAIIEFQSGGQFTLQYLVKQPYTNNGGFIVDDKLSGDFFLDEKGILTLVYNWAEDVGALKTKIRYFTRTCEYKFATFTSDFIKLENMTVAEPSIQCNKIQ
jgi:hypothetical protein